VNEVSMTFLHPYCDDRKELVFTRETIDTVWDSVASNTNH
jgi:hypothetical protein